MKSKLYSVVETAELLDVSAWTVYQWLNKRKLIGYKIGGGKWKISEKHINDFLNKYETNEEL